MPCSAKKRSIAIVGYLAILCVALEAFGQTVDRIESVNFSPGQSANLTAYGKGLTEVAYLWTPFGTLAGKAVDDATKDVVAVFEGAVPADLIPGVYETRVVTKTGVSDSKFLVVDDLPSFSVPNAGEANPPDVVLPATCCVNGQVNPLKSKFFALELSKGQAVSIEVFARRIDSVLDPVLRLSNSAGTELAFVDDTTGIAGDAQLAFTAPADDRYVLELRDVKYGGGGSHFFHLRIGSFPVVQGTFPGQTSGGSLAFVAHDQADTVAEVSLVKSSTQSVRQVVARGTAGSALVSVVPIPHGPQLELEPNNDRDSATHVDASMSVCAIAGRIQSVGDVDWYRFTAEKKQHLCVTARTREFGSPADVVLELYSSDGNKLKESDDQGQMDAQVSVGLPAPGEYFLCVRELASQGGATWTYDLELNFAGRLELTTASDRIGVSQGGTATIPIVVKRLGISAPIQLTVVGLPQGIESPPVMVSPNQKTAFVSFHSNSQAAAFICERLQLEAKLDSGTTVPVVVTPPAPKSPEHKLLRFQTGVFVYSTPAAAYSLSTNSSSLSLSPGHEARVVITASRSGEWTFPVDVASAVPANELPAGITIGTVQITADSAELAVNAGSGARPGNYSISLSGTSTKDKTVVVQAIPTIQLEVLQPSTSK